MKSLFAAAAYLVLTASAFAQTYYTDLASYCHHMIEVSTVTLMARTQGISKSEVEDHMRDMTDPLAIRMVKELIEFAYSHPQSSSVDALRIELRNLCLAKKIFAQ
jgi:hypothetical protein